MTHILILEDDTDFGTLMAEGLEDQGYEVTLFDRASKALAFLEKARIDLVITDVFVEAEGQLIPDGGVTLIGGIRAASRYSKAAQNRDVPIIAITGRGGLLGKEFGLANAAGIGANAGLQKPFAQPELLDTIKRLLKNA
ncbi:response regulator transcription factor [Yoonia sp. R2331]|uniref:response regulator transcription factor n=1 Tax=Yoonia sp. R2331 TaxID=3237238 RepID=UPI0034E5ACE2